MSKNEYYSEENITESPKNIMDKGYDRRFKKS